MLLHTHHMWHTAAAAYAVLGKPAPAIRLLKKAASLGLPNYTMFRDDPHLVSLHDEPQFSKLLAGLKRELAGYQREFGATASKAAAGSRAADPGRRQDVH